ncbi:glutamate dehydrogenase (NAD(P)(+)) [Candidatus Vecturithrix granuli]|uniref:Glutamate dehydrogenase (NAD(P)(+)) n=1 Tax=Vecturithrix granuli TaxID=1499967 RepID=A0A081C9F5_VECG1|nr:glutamate dehydrogenase (NAD(P)(+)) [Candidatus Vecturithrix granuli]
MIPKKMQAYLREHLPESTIENRLICDGPLRFLEFGYKDVHLLSRLGITRDKLGPRLVACVWNDASPLEIGGFVVVDNLAMGQPSMGGIRMLPDITPIDIHNLARGMTLKNAAANLPYGGGKSGIVAELGLSPEEHREVVRGFARLIRRYKEIYVPGPDVGTNDADMKTVAIENGMDSAVSKPADMGGNRIDELGGAAGGVVIALQRLLEIMPRLRVLPQFANLQIPDANNITVLIQGFGAVGAHAGRILGERLPDARVIGVSDLFGYLYDECGLPTEKLFALWQERKFVTTPYYQEVIAKVGEKKCPTKFSTDANDLLRESAFCFIPATPVFNYLGVMPSEGASMTVDRMGTWSLIVEGANTYSPDLNRKAARARMEQVVYRQKGVMIATDYLVNSGGVIFAAQEHLVKTPAHLRFPKDILGKREAVDRWLAEHAAELAELSETRRIAGEEYREKVIAHNMNELVEFLTTDINMLPCQAAERISIRRLTAKEHERTAKDIMQPIPTIEVSKTIQEAAALLVEQSSTILAVLSTEGTLTGIVTDWDLTRAIAQGFSGDLNLEKIMTREVVFASPFSSILDIVHELEQNAISAMPVVDEGRVLGMVTSDLLAYRYLLRFLESEVE